MKITEKLRDIDKSTSESKDELDTSIRRVIII